MSDDLLSCALNSPPVAALGDSNATTMDLSGCGEKLYAEGCFIASQDGQNFARVHPDAIKDLLAQQYLVYYIDEVANPLNVAWSHSNNVATSPLLSSFLDQGQLIESISTNRTTQKQPDYFKTEVSSAPTQVLVPSVQNEMFGQLSLNGVLVPVYGTLSDTNPVGAVTTQVPTRSGGRNAVIRLCPVCGVHFSTKKSYTCHMNVHELDKPFRCSCCDLTFNHDVNRVIHETIQHNHNPPYTCPICSVTVSRWSAFKFHLTQHQLDDSVVCPLCSKSFESQCLVDAHVRVEHPHSSPAVTPGGYRCRLCRMLLPNVGKLQKHYRTYHPSELKSRRTARATVFEPQQTNNSASSISTASPVEGKKSRLSKLHARSFIKSTLSSGKAKRPVAFESFIKQLEVEQLPTKPLDRSTKWRKKTSGKIVRPSYSCDICGKKFAKPCMVRRHALQHTNEKPFQCLICHMKFTQKSTAKSHVMMHHQSRHRSPCPFCPRQFRSSAILAKHVHSRHGIMSYACRPPDQLNVTSVLENFVSNEPQPLADATTYSNVITVSTTDVTPNQCTTLFSSDKTAEDTFKPVLLQLPDASHGHCNFVNHPVTASDPVENSLPYRRYRCSLCPKSFSSSATLSVHMLRHPTTLSPFVCHFCPLRFSTSPDLVRHLHSHSQRGPHRITRRLGLSRRLLAQSSSPLKWNNSSQCFLSTRRTRGDRSFKCSLCSRSYKHLVHLNYHVRQSHCSDQTAFKCAKCAKHFVNERRLTRHVKEAHSSRTSQPNLTCPICSSHFATVSSMKRHMAIHSDFKPYKCHVCHKMFKFHSSCLKHIKANSCSPVNTAPCNPDVTSLEPASHTVDLDEVSHKGHITQLGPASDEVTFNFPATDGELVHHPKQGYTFAYFTNAEHEVGTSSVNATIYQTAGDTADETRLENGVIRDWSGSFLYDPSLLPGSDCVFMCQTNTTSTQGYPNLDHGNTGAMIDDHLLSESAHLLPQLTDSRYSDTQGYPAVIVGNTSTNGHLEHMPDTTALPVVHQPDLPDNTMESSGLIHAPTNSTKESLLNSCLVNPMPSCPSFSDSTVRPILNGLESKQSVQSSFLFGCGVCHASFEFPQSLAMHVQVNHSVRPKPFHCDTCGFRFASETLLTIHKREHSDVSNTGISCPSCPLLEFGNKSALTRHVLLCHPLPTQDRFRCTHCDARFRLLRSLKTHVAGLMDAEERRRSDRSLSAEPKPVLKRKRKHRRERVPVIDPILLRSVTQQALLPQESLTLSERYLFDCAREFATNSKDNAKPLTSEGIVDGIDRTHVKRHLCSTCGRSFASVSSLKHHTRAHLGIRPYQCTDCGEQFTKNCLLQRHIVRAHTTQQPVASTSSALHETPRIPPCLVGFRCHLCDRTLRSKNSLRCHVRRHAASRTYKCPYCRTCFMSWGQRRKHLHECQEFNDNAQGLPVFHCRSTAEDPNVNRSTTDLTVSHAPGAELESSVLLTGGDNSSNIPLVVNFLAEDGNQVFPLSVGANILIPVQLDENVPTQTGWTSATLSSQVLPGVYFAPHGSEIDAPSSNEVISVVDLSQTQSFIQTALEPSVSVGVTYQLTSLSGSYHEAICCHSCHAKFPDNRAYSKHHCAQTALLRTRFPNPIKTADTDVVSHRRRRRYRGVARPKRTASPGAGRSFRRLHKCATCSRIFSQAYLLKRHERTHTNCRPFVCKLCGAGFSQSYQLTTHTLIHSGAKPYACSQCDREFRQKSNLQRHIKLVHSSNTG